ncbi:hypothetical protein N431DRAFT_558567 [Stipitochalara longipes BDJ]|nr:hypothetical protein N431DRAFT_558567 [Stipitochalara longipes BDJ]
MADNTARLGVARQTPQSETDIMEISQSPATSPTPTITVSSPEKGNLWQEQALRDPESGIVEAVPWIWPNHGIWIFITVASTFVLISIIPIMLIDILTSSGVGIPDAQVAPIIARSLQLETASWNYDNLCQPRKGQCQLGTYTTRNSKTMDLSWFDEDCRKVDYVAACQDLACKDATIVLTSVNDSDSSYPDPVRVQFRDPGNYLDVPTIMHGGAIYSQDENEVGSWFGPESDIEHFSLLRFDC